ncbi:MAG: hypothetical protein ACOY3X_08520 [Pseudomonadota bacterium]
MANLNEIHLMFGKIPSDMPFHAHVRRMQQEAISLIKGVSGEEIEGIREYIFEAIEWFKSDLEDEFSQGKTSAKSPSDKIYFLGSEIDQDSSENDLWEFAVNELGIDGVLWESYNRWLPNPIPKNEEKMAPTYSAIFALIEIGRAIAAKGPTRIQHILNATVLIGDASLRNVTHLRVRSTEKSFKEAASKKAAKAAHASHAGDEKLKKYAFSLYKNLPEEIQGNRALAARTIYPAVQAYAKAETLDTLAYGDPMAMSGGYKTLRDWLRAEFPSNGKIKNSEKQVPSA